MPTKKTPKKAVKKTVKKSVTNKVNARKGREGALGQKVVANKVNTRKGREGALGQKASTKQTQKYAAAKKKPVSKKVAAKKTVANKVNTRKGREGALGRKATKAVAMKKPNKDLVYAADQESFWTTDGEILNSLMSLSEAFGEMEKGVYQFHAEGDQNDFSVWVETVLCDGECAAELAKAKTHKGAKTIVKKHLKNYSK